MTWNDLRAWRSDKKGQFTVPLESQRVLFINIQNEYVKLAY